MKCPINSHYEVCAEACSASCAGLTEIVQCPSNCTEGCDCDAGFLFNGQTCVKEIECGCYENGKTYKVRLRNYNNIVFLCVKVALTNTDIEITLFL